MNTKVKIGDVVKVEFVEVSEDKGITDIIGQGIVEFQVKTDKALHSKWWLQGKLNDEVINMQVGKKKEIELDKAKKYKIKLLDITTHQYNEKKKFIIDANNFSDIRGFYDEIERVLIGKDYGWGRNLDAFEDILRGDFGKFHEFEEIILIWKNHEKSRNELKNFDELIEIIKEHNNLKLKLN